MKTKDAEYEDIGRVPDLTSRKGKSEGHCESCRDKG